MRTKIILILSIICIMPTLSFANTNDYDHSLEKIGIDYETYRNMPDNKQKLYSGIKIKNTEKCTKYYKIVEPSIDEQDLKRNNINTMKEISKEQFTFEVSNYLNKRYISSLRNEDTDETDTSWVTMTTKIGECFDNEWVLSNDVTYIKCNSSLLSPISTHITGLGTNQNFSVIADSEYCKRNYDIISTELGIYIPDQTDYYWEADEKSTSGYAFTYNIVDTELNNTAFMALRIIPNVSNTTVADGYGHYSKYTKSVTPSLSFSSGGASLSITPTSKLSTAPKTHVQLRYN